MIYQTGSVNVIQGSNTVSGIGTEFLKYVSKGSLFSRFSDSDFYVIVQVVNNTTLILSKPYGGLSGTNVPYAINLDQTPNLGLPIISRNDPDSTEVANQGLRIIDKQSGNFLSFKDLGNVTYSGESAFFMNNEYQDDELVEGRVVNLVDSLGESIAIDIIDVNYLFKGYQTQSISDRRVYFTSINSGELSVGEKDILRNITKEGYCKIDSVDTVNKYFTISGEVIQSGEAWEGEDVLEIYGKTLDMGVILTGLTSSSLSVSPMSGHSFVDGEESTNFPEGSYLYNYNKGNYRAIAAASYNGGNVDITTYPSTDDWNSGEVVYTILSKYTTQTSHLTSSIASIKYGAQSQIGSSQVKETHIDFGVGEHQVNASRVPCTVSGLISTNLKDALEELLSLLNSHNADSSSAHVAGSISFSDDGGTIPLTSTDQNSAINEVKNRLAYGIKIPGVVDSMPLEYQVTDETFQNYPLNFFSGEDWHLIFEDGVNAGEIKQVQSFNIGEGSFVFTSGEAFTYVGSEGDAFTLLYKGSGDIIVSGEVYDNVYTKTELNTSGAGGAVHFDNISGFTGDIVVEDLDVYNGQEIDTTLGTIYRLQSVGGQLYASLSDYPYSAKDITLIGVSDVNYPTFRESDGNIDFLATGEIGLKKGNIVKLTWVSGETTWRETFSYTT